MPATPLGGDKRSARWPIDQFSLGLASSRLTPCGWRLTIGSWGREITTWPIHPPKKWDRLAS